MDSRSSSSSSTRTTNPDQTDSASATGRFFPASLQSRDLQNEKSLYRLDHIALYENGRTGSHQLLAYESGKADWENYPVSERNWCERNGRKILFVSIIIVVLAVIAAVVTAALVIDGPPPQYVRVNVKAKVLNHTYTPNLANPTSDEFVKLQSDFCSQVGDVVDQDPSTTGYKGCRLESARNGSVILVVMFYFDVIGSSMREVNNAVTLIFKPSSTSPTVKVAAFIIVTASVEVETTVVEQTVLERPAILPSNLQSETSSISSLSSSLTPRSNSLMDTSLPSSSSDVSESLQPSAVLESSSSELQTFSTVSEAKNQYTVLESSMSSLGLLFSSAVMESVNSSTASEPSSSPAAMEYSSSSVDVYTRSSPAAMEYSSSSSVVESSSSSAALDLSRPSASLDISRQSATLKSSSSSTVLEYTSQSDLLRTSSLSDGFEFSSVLETSSGLESSSVAIESIISSDSLGSSSSSTGLESPSLSPSLESSSLSPGLESSSSLSPVLESSTSPSPGLQFSSMSSGLQPSTSLSPDLESPSSLSNGLESPTNLSPGLESSSLSPGLKSSSSLSPGLESSSLSPGLKSSSSLSPGLKSSSSLSPGLKSSSSLSPGLESSSLSTGVDSSSQRVSLESSISLTVSSIWFKSESSSFLTESASSSFSMEFQGSSLATESPSSLLAVESLGLSDGVESPGSSLASEALKSAVVSATFFSSQISPIEFSSQSHGMANSHLQTDTSSPSVSLVTTNPSAAKESITSYPVLETSSSSITDDSSNIQPVYSSSSSFFVLSAHVLELFRSSHDISTPALPEETSRAIFAKETSTASSFPTTSVQPTSTGSTVRAMSSTVTLHSTGSDLDLIPSPVTWDSSVYTAGLSEYPSPIRTMSDSTTVYSQSPLFSGLLTASTIDSRVAQTNTLPIEESSKSDISSTSVFSHVSSLPIHTEGSVVIQLLSTVSSTAVNSVPSTIEPTVTSEFLSSSGIPTTAPLPFSLSMEGVTVNEMEDVTLECRLVGNYTLDHVQFLKDGELLPRSPGISEDKTSFTYIILNASCTDSGQYMCEVAGEEGNISTTAQVSVEVKSGEPTLTVPFEIVEGRWKETSLFICKYKQGIPVSGVYWSASLANGTIIDHLNFQRNDFVEENQTDSCALEATSQFYNAFSMGFNGSSICCNVKQGENVSSACEDIHVIESNTCENRSGSLEHPYSCQLWIECVNNIVYVNSCPKGSCINIESVVCEVSTSKKETPSTDPFSCEGRPSSYIPRSTTYPDNCKDYHWCVNGKPNKGACAGDTTLAANTTSSVCTPDYQDSYCAHRAAEEASKASTISPSTTVNPSRPVVQTPEMSQASQLETTVQFTVPSTSIESTSTAWMTSSSITLSTPAPVTLRVTNVTVSAGEDVVLVCATDGNVSVTTLQFLKDGKTLSGSLDISEDKVELKSVISHTMCTDSGDYTCSATGEERNMTATTQVVVQVKPEVIKLTVPFNIVEKRETPEALFKCEYKQGYPVEVAYWTGTLANGSFVVNPRFTHLENIVPENQTDECALDATSQFYHGFSMDWNASTICCNVKQGQSVSSSCAEVLVVPGDTCQGEQYYEHPYSCRLWIECVGSTIYISSCQEDECYNIDSGICQKDLSVGPKGDYSCEGRADAATIPREYTYPDNCKDYYFCANGVRYNRTCDPGTYFLSVRTNQYCGYTETHSYCAEKAGENGTEVTTAPAASASTAAPSLCECGTYEYIPTEYTYPANCTEYYRCVNGIRLPYTCQPSTAVNYRIAQDSVPCVHISSGETYCNKVEAGEMDAC